MELKLFVFWDNCAYCDRQSRLLVVAKSREDANALLEATTDVHPDEWSLIETVSIDHLKEGMVIEA